MALQLPPFRISNQWVISDSYYFTDDGYFRSTRQAVDDRITAIKCLHRSARFLMFQVFGFICIINTYY